MAKRRRSRRSRRGLGCVSCGTAGLGSFGFTGGRGWFANPVTTVAIVAGGIYLLNRARQAGGGSVVSGLGNWMASAVQAVGLSPSRQVSAPRWGTIAQNMARSGGKIVRPPPAMFQRTGRWS